MKQRMEGYERRERERRRSGLRCGVLSCAVLSCAVDGKYVKTGCAASTGLPKFRTSFFSVF